jgi:hypothetical protein
MWIDFWDIFNKRNPNKFWNYQIKIKFPLRWIKKIFNKNK